MTTDNIELPPLPSLLLPEPLVVTFANYARAAVIADRERRAEQAQPAKPTMFRRTLDLSEVGAFVVSPCGVVPTGWRRVTLCWTDDGRAWIESEDSRSLARSLRSMYCDPLILAAADALDGGVR